MRPPIAPIFTPMDEHPKISNVMYSSFFIYMVLMIMIKYF